MPHIGNFFFPEVWLEDTPTDNEVEKAPTSNWAFDHKAAVDDHHAWPPLGSYVDKDVNTNYQAATDGFVVAFMCVFAAGDRGYIEGLEGAGSPPDVVLCSDYAIYTAADDKTERASITFPVAKDRYWKVTSNIEGGSGLFVVRWVALG